MSNIDKQALRQIAESVDREEWDVLDNGDADYQVIVSGSLERGATYRSYQPVTNEISNKKIAAFIAAFNPKVALALLDELKTKEEQRANWFQMTQKLGEDLDAAEKRNAEQREYYEGVIADGSKRIAELESRTVTVKMYDDFQLCHYGTTEDYAKGYIDSQNNFTKWLSAAGIKVKGE
ncbi:ead/Ea22-like family protein [Salmonella enterica]|nr:ead/Ea22-like family protein [Salmonella enterica]EDT8160108.1 ead/Ea22-like family protein [Salmonella enterica subsp. arizonae]EDX3026676.1 ead/Ea22-like family protein [Salmonella enterica subsp. houtenae serovar 48:g,z51:-]MBA3159942.1 ead/Ea22-like family protein [Salmonella enterica subsp. arizonae serovar 48:z4,z24:-]EAU9845306.1 ead/Ea22-like family protein [Salmonella enterica]